MTSPGMSLIPSTFTSPNDFSSHTFFRPQHIDTPHQGGKTKLATNVATVWWRMTRFFSFSVNLPYFAQFQRPSSYDLHALS